MPPWASCVLIVGLLPIILYIADPSILSQHSLYSAICPQKCPAGASNLHTGHFGYECAGKPHHSSWTSWWHPQRSNGVASEHKLGAGTTTNEWNILYHLGGNGPWVEKVIDVVDEGIAVPEGCHVEQVHMVGHYEGKEISAEC